MYSYAGNCSCKTVQIQLSIPESIEAFVPRACDCDFCQSRNASYLSDPKGHLVVKSKLPLNEQRQGSLQAIFHSCPQCGELVMVTCTFESVVKGALNSAMLECSSELAQPVSVSPKLLGAGQKASRWDSNWMKVEIRDRVT